MGTRALTSTPLGTPARTAMEKLPRHLRLGITLPGMRELFAACEDDVACLSIYDQSCDGAGDWLTCRSATGLERN